MPQAKRKPSIEKLSPKKPAKRSATISSPVKPATEPGHAKKTKTNTVNPDFLASLITSKCSELTLPNLFTVKKEDRICDVWGKLIAKLIMAAPVVDAQGDFQGFIDTSDIASYLVAKFGDPMIRSNKEIDSLTESMTQGLKVWMDKTVGDVMAFDYPTKLRCPPVCYANYSLLSAFEPLAMISGLHRVAVVESPTSNRLVTVITQSQALGHIFDNANHLGSRKTKPIEDCIDVIKSEGIFVVTKDHIALDAFQHMLKHGVSALAVVSAPNGQIKGVIALRDLQVIGNDASDLWKLYIGVESFLKFKTIARVVTVVERELSSVEPKLEAKSEIMVDSTNTDAEMKEEKMAEPEPPKDIKSKHGPKKASAIDLLPVASSLQCKQGDTFVAAIKKLAQHGVHRLFVTNDDFAPIGVVSIKEVLKEILH
jgi:CBS domain-containing protein